jgi:hypothetical protein
LGEIVRQRKTRIGIKLAAIVALLLVAVLGAYFATQQTAAFKAARAKLLSLPEVESLGQPVTARLKLFGYSVPTTDSNETAEFTLDLEGKYGTGVALIRIKKQPEQWNVVHTSLTLDF